MRLTRKQFHEQVYFYALIFIAISLPLSVFTATLAQILLLANWIVEGRFREKWDRFKKNRALWFFLAFYVIHAVGLFWSQDGIYSYKDMRVKVSLFILPLILGTSVPLVKAKVDRILLLFTMAVFAGSIASVMALAGWLNVKIEGYRDLSLFISHIRFSLMIVVAILVVVYFLFIQHNSISRFERIFYMLSLVWLPIFLILLKSLSGIFIMGFVAFCLLVRTVFEIRDPVIRFMVFVPVIMIPLGGLVYLGHSINKYYSFDEINPEDIDAFTVRGNPYENRPEMREVENGHYVWLHVCDMEMEEEWNKLSDVDYYGKTTNGNSLRGTLIRFLTSKGLRKDAAGIAQLTSAEIRAIEHGVANHIYLHRFRLYPRIYEVIWEIDRYRMGYSPNDKSVVQRYLYLDAGWKIAMKHPVFGVGNGNVQKVFHEYYESIDSPLTKKWRRRAHNQFLTFFISFGITGLVICVTSLVAPIFLAGRQRSFLALSFFILMLLSMLSEDTLETAVGSVFVAFFMSLFIFGPDYPWLRRKLFRAHD